MKTLPDPFPGIKSKQRIQANVPTNIHEKLFLEQFPRHGTQDRVISVFVGWLHAQTKDWSGTPIERERKLKELLSPLYNQQPISPCPTNS